MGKDFRIVEVGGIGSVLLERSSRAKRLSISVKPDNSIRVAVPLRVSFRAGHRFALKNQNWTLKTLKKMKRLRSNPGVGELKVDDFATAAQQLIDRLAFLAKEHDFSYNRVSIRNQKTRWGSCSPKNNISLNVKLAAITDRLRDYVILHELVHTRVKNHGVEFWRELDKIMGSGKGMQKELNSYSIMRIE